MTLHELRMPHLYPVETYGEVSLLKARRKGARAEFRSFIFDMTLEGKRAAYGE